MMLLVKIGRICPFGCKGNITDGGDYVSDEGYRYRYVSVQFASLDFWS